MPAVQCPACGKDSFARRTGAKSLAFRELYYHCRDIDDCGHIFVVGMEALRTIRPSMVAAPLYPLPLTTWRPSHASVANDRGTNDDSPPDQPAAIAMTS